MTPPLPDAPAASPRAPAADHRGYQLLVDVVSHLSRARDLPEIMAIVRRAARELTGADGATFVLRDREMCFYADEDAITPLWKGQRFPMEHCVSGWVMMNRKPAIVVDIFNDPRVPVDTYQPTFVRSVVMVPIRTSNPIGAIGTYWASERIAPPEEIDLLQALADTTAVAIENVRVYAELETRVRERTVALESFTSAVSHDLRAPIRQIQVFAEMLQETHGEAMPAACADGLGTIAHEAGQVGDMADALLELSRTDGAPLQRELIDLAVIARSVALECRARHQHPVRFTTPESLSACMDPTLARIALTNLLGNAWKFTANTNDAAIEVGQLADLTSGDLTWFVRDNGDGFDGDHAMHLFGVFKRMHKQSEFPGAGVGLATVRRIVERHGGAIRATSERGRGATFVVSLGPESTPPAP